MSEPSLDSEVTYRDLEDKLLVIVLELEGVQNRGQLSGVEFHCAITSVRAVCLVRRSQYC